MRDFVNRITIIVAFFAFAALTGCVGPSSVESPEATEMKRRLDEVFETYYRNPDLDAVIAISPEVEELLKTRNALPMVGFYYGVRKTAGARQEEFVKAMEPYELLKSIVSGIQEEDIKKIFELPPEELAPGILDFYWGYFFATGDEKAVEKVVRRGAMRFPADCTVDMTAAAARWSAKSLAESHEPVRQVIDEFLAGASEAERKEFEAGESR